MSYYVTTVTLKLLAAGLLPEEMRSSSGPVECPGSHQGLTGTGGCGFHPFRPYMPVTGEHRYGQILDFARRIALPRVRDRWDPPGV